MSTQNNKLDLEGQNFYAGFEKHSKYLTISILSEYIILKRFTIPPKPEVLSDFFLKNYPVSRPFSNFMALKCLKNLPTH